MITGEHDQPSVTAGARALAEGTGAELIEIAATAHVPSMERPAEFDAAVLPFLKGSDPFRIAGPEGGVGGSGGSDSSLSSPTFGSTRSSHFGIHQFALPNRTITDGTSRQRTIVASTAIATARPTPNCFTVGSPLRMKLANTLTMISAAEVITRALVASPRITDSRLSSVSVKCSWIRETQEHLVVHREAEQDREHQQRHEALDRYRVREPDQRVPQPFSKIAVRTPYAAATESRFMIPAVSGTRTERKAIIRSRNESPTTIAITRTSLSEILSARSM